MSLDQQLLQDEIIKFLYGRRSHMRVRDSFILWSRGVKSSPEMLHFRVQGSPSRVRDTPVPNTPSLQLVRDVVVVR